MVIQAQLADGTTLEFPDGTPDSVINSAVKSQLGVTTVEAQPIPPTPEQVPLADSLAQGAEDFSVGLTAGVARLPLGASQLATQVLGSVSDPTEGRQVAERFQQALSAETNKLFNQGVDFNTAVDQARINVQEAGIPDPSQLTLGDVQRSQASVARGITKATEQASKTSPILTAVGEIAGEVGQLAPIGVGATSPLAIAKAGGLFGAISGGLSPTGEIVDVGQDVKNRLRDATIQGLGGAAFGGLAAKGIQKLPAAAAAVADGIGGGTDTLKRGVSKLLGINPIAAREFIDSGLANQVAAISDSNTIRAFDRLTEKLPFVSNVVQKSTDATLLKINQTIDALGRSKAVTQQEAGEIIQRGGERFVSRFKDISDKLYNRLDGFIPPAEEFGLGNIIKLSQTVKGRAAGAPNLQEALQKSEGAQMLNSILEDAALKGGKLSYENIKRYRTRIGEKLNDGHLLSRGEKPILKEAYGALTQDMRIAAESKGQRALTAFDRANRFYNDGAQKIENTIQKLINEQAPERVFRNAVAQTKIGDTRVRGIFKTLNPEEREILRGTVLNDLGQSANGFSFKKFITDYNKISPEAKRTIFGAEHMNSLNKLGAVSQRLGELQRFENPSGTANQLATAALFGGGLFAEPVVAGTSLVAGNLGARLLNNPSFTRWLANAATKEIKPTQIGTVIRQLEAVAKNNPEIAGDIGQYATKIGILGESRVVNGAAK